MVYNIVLTTLINIDMYTVPISPTLFFFFVFLENYGGVLGCLGCGGDSGRCGTTHFASQGTILTASNKSSTENLQSPHNSWHFPNPAFQYIFIDESMNQYLGFNLSIISIVFTSMSLVFGDV